MKKKKPALKVVKKKKLKKPVAAKIINAKEGERYNPKDYDYNPVHQAWDGIDPMKVRTTVDMLRAMERDPTIELDARVLAYNGKTRVNAKMDSAQFREAFKNNENIEKLAIRIQENGGWGGGLIGNDFTPLVGGPFYKNLYFYTDYIRMHSDAFFAYNNDPFARAITHITRDFVIGTGYEVQTDQDNQFGKIALAAWKAFEEANDLQEQIDQCTIESSIYGEVMFWKLPKNEAKITYNLSKQDTDPKAIIPRIRIIDPSNIVEIITYPEDISRPLAYVWLQPTQYQILTSSTIPGVPQQPSLKFIYRQIPAEEMLHFKLNCVSNEKRGRSDYFPIFNYLKRLRDAVDYGMISLEKVSAWSIDTTIDGDQTDITQYMQGQRALGTIPPAGSEFVHTKAITREYLGNANAGGHSSDIFQWALSMISAGSGIPVNWFGSHLSGGSTRASALVATEPVSKKMEKRREFIKRILKKMWALCMKEAGIEDPGCNIVFPELITQDRAQKLKDLLLCEEARWIKPERAATLAAKELGISNFSYSNELEDMKQEIPNIPQPLIDPAQGDPNQDEPGSTGLTGQDKQDIKKNDSTL